VASESREEQIRAKEIELQKAELALARLQGKYGLCEMCGNEGWFYAWGTPECVTCAEKRLKEKYRTKFEYLIGKQIINVDVDTTLGDLYSITLDDGTEITAESNNLHLSIVK
jgi:hypothetical protein